MIITSTYTKTRSIDLGVIRINNDWSGLDDDLTQHFGEDFLTYKTMHRSPTSTLLTFDAVGKPIFYFLGYLQSQGTVPCTLCLGVHHLKRHC